MTKTDSKGRSSSKRDLILDVYPEDADPFRAETREWFSDLRFPDQGDTLQVLCDPEQRAVEVDLSEDVRFNPKLFRAANEAARKSQHEETLNAPPGTAAVVDDPELAALLSLEAEGQDSAEK